MSDFFRYSSMDQRIRKALILSVIGLVFSPLGVGGIFSVIALSMLVSERRLSGDLTPMGIVALISSLIGLVTAILITVYVAVVFSMMAEYIGTPEFSSLLEQLIERAESTAP